MFDANVNFMNKLELKIPPVAVAFAGIMSMWITSALIPQWTCRLPWRNEFAVSLIIIGALFGISGILAFRKINTTVNPMKPESASLLVATGVFSMSRNPMYLGLFFVLASWGVYLSHPLSLGCLLVFVGYMTRFQIIPEEKALLQLFGQEYGDYKRNTRRWL